MKVKSIPMAMTIFAGALVTSLPVVAQDANTQAADEILKSAELEGIEMSRKEAEEMAAQVAEEEVEEQAKRCWVTNVVKYSQGKPASKSPYNDPEQIKGKPDAKGYTHDKALSLGNDGYVDVSFGKKFIANGYKLYIYEMGTDREDVLVQVRAGETWYPADPGFSVKVQKNPNGRKAINISDVVGSGIGPDIVFDAVRIRDVHPGGAVGALAAGADIDAVGIDCDALPVGLDFVDAIVTEEGVVVTWGTGFEEKVAEMQLWRAPLDGDDNPVVDQATLIGEKYPFHTQNYFVLDNETLSSGRYGYAVRELNDDGTEELHLEEMTVVEVE